MKIEKKLSNEQILTTSDKSIEMKITEKNMPVVFKLIVETLYRNKIGSMIREVTSNAHDSHVEAGVTSPVIVKLSKNPESGNYLSFIDNGVGMSPERVENVYCSLGESTKNDTNDEIGGFGIGGKTPLAYTKSFFIITRYEGIKYTYTARMGELVPIVELFSKEETDEHNGTEIKVKIPESDIRTVRHEITKQLYYFENIVFQGFTEEDDEEGEAKLNDYNIYKGKTFVYRGTEYSNQMHVCLGKVAYPIDFSALEIDNEYDYRMPVAIKLNIGDVKVISSREDLEYDDATKKVIIKKLEEVKNELKEMLSKQYENITTLEEYYYATEDFGKILFPDGNTIHVDGIVSKSEVSFENFKYNMFKVPTKSKMLDLLYYNKKYGKPVAKRSYNESHPAYRGNWDSFKTIPNALHVKETESFERKIIKQAFLNSEHGRYFLFTPYNLDGSVLDSLSLAVGATKEKVTAWDEKDEYEVVISKTKSLPLIKKLRKDFIKMVEAESINYNSMVVPQWFIDERKNNKSLSKDILKVGIPMKSMSYGRSSRVTMAELQNFKGRIFYGFRDDEYTLRNAESLSNVLVDSDKIVHVSEWNGFPKNGILFAQISKGNEKYMKMLDNNVLHVDYFYNLIVNRKVDVIVEDKINGMISNRFYNEVNELFKKSGFEHVDKEIAEDVDVIQKSLAKIEGGRINGSLDKSKFMALSGIDVENITIDDYKHKDILDRLVDISDKSEKYLKHLDIPWHLDGEMEEELMMFLELSIVK